MPTAANWYHANVKSISRGKGKTYVGLVAYATGQKLQNPETGRQDKRNHPGDVVSWGIVAPSHAPSWFNDKSQIERLAQAVQASETRSNAQFSNHWDIALWRNGTPEQHEQLARRISERYVERYGTLVVYAVHAPSGEGSEHNWHLHLAPNMRRMTEIGFGAKATEITDGKTRHLETEWVRRMIADETNAFLKNINSDERVSHQSYRQRGILKQPMIHMGNNAWQAEKRGIRTDPGNWNREIHAINLDIDNTQKRRPSGAAKMSDDQGDDRRRGTEQRAAMDASTRNQLDQIERFTELRREGDRIKTAFEAEQEEARKLEEHRLYQRTAGSDITDARTRWLEAVADSPRQQEWDKLLAAAVGIEGARAKREHDDLTRKAELAQTPDQKKDILYVRDIQFYEYMAITEERQVGISRVISGYKQRRDLNGPDIMDTEGERQKRPWEVHADQSRGWREQANQLRQEREQHQERASWRELDEINRKIEQGGARINASTQIPNEEGHRPTRTVSEDISASRENQDWREVRPNEVFEPGRQFRVSVDGTRSEVYEPEQKSQRENPFDAVAARDQERHAAGEEMTDAKKERPEPEQSDQTKERRASRGERWNAEEREIQKMEQELNRGGGSMGR
jgi:hypothetical protein